MNPIVSPSNKTVIVGMSGGVDSSVTAYLLQQQGFKVAGLFMRNWQEDDEHCPATQDLADARAVCAKLDIPLHTINFSQRYWDRVFQHFLDEYAAGRTPNPDILCNKEIKFRAFLDYAKEKLNADFIATGHYARVTHDTEFTHLLRGLDNNKDQSYFLHQLSQEQLRDVLFPVGELNKTEVRRIATEQGFINHAKKDSTGICFIGERKFKAFLSQYLLAQPGNIITDQGDIVGQHTGLMYYTLGQRQGIGIGGLKNSNELPWYVVAKRVQDNALIIAQGIEHTLLFASELSCEQVNWITAEPRSLPFTCTAKIRYRQADQACFIEKSSETQYHVTFNEPQRAITPGQSIVFYQGEECLGGGVILGE